MVSNNPPSPSVDSSSVVSKSNNNNSSKVDIPYSIYKKKMLTGEVQLTYAIQVFGYTHQKDNEWIQSTLANLKAAGIDSITDLLSGCRDQTINIDLELFGISPEQRFSNKVMDDLMAFLPGPVGFRCFRLAQAIATKVEKGSAETDYVHRPQSGKMGNEEWNVTVGDKWVVNVDCAGFVRNALKHVTKNPFVMALSDRDFMRAKDFYDFFSTIPFTVTGGQMEIPDGARLMRWRIVPDLRMVLPGDVIVYRPRGNAAGGAAFTKNDRKDLNHLLLAVKTALIWQELRSTGALVTKNISRDPDIKPWVKSLKEKLHAIGIRTVKELTKSIPTLNDKLKEKDFPTLNAKTIEYLEECSTTVETNTGHIVFASAPAVDLGHNNEYRIRVVHSTKYGKLDKNGEVLIGVQEHYRRFKVIEGPYGEQIWTRPNSVPPPSIATTTPPTTAATTTTATHVATNTTTTNNNNNNGSSPATKQQEASVSKDNVMEDGDTTTPIISAEDENDNPNDDMEEPDDLVKNIDDDGVPSGDPIIEEDTTTATAGGANGGGGGDDVSAKAIVDVIAARMCF